jgi:uncharacterized damage-inducible protein DinB
MSVPIDILATHLRYTAWASQRIVQAAATLSADELNRDFKTADKSVLGTLVHTYAGDRIWIGRILGNPPDVFIDPEADMKLSVLQNDWPRVHQRWFDWIASLGDPSEIAHYRDIKGNQHSTPLWQIVLHAVNHGTHHRGQASSMIRAMGHTPPPLDLIFYYRELATPHS